MGLFFWVIFLNLVMSALNQLEQSGKAYLEAPGIQDSDLAHPATTPRRPRDDPARARGGSGAESIFFHFYFEWGFFFWIIDNHEKFAGHLTLFTYRILLRGTDLWADHPSK